MNKLETVLKSDGESEWVEVVGEMPAIKTGFIDWIGDGRTRKKGGPSADQSMKMAKGDAERAKAEKDAEVAARAESTGICPIAQKIIDHAKKGWSLKRNQIGDYRMDGPGSFDGSFGVSKSAAESAISNGVVLA